VAHNPSDSCRSHWKISQCCTLARPRVADLRTEVTLEATPEQRRKGTQKNHREVDLEDGPPGPSSGRSLDF